MAGEKATGGKGPGSPGPGVMIAAFVGSSSRQLTIQRNSRQRIPEVIPLSTVSCQLSFQKRHFPNCRVASGRQAIEIDSAGKMTPIEGKCVLACRIATVGKNCNLSAQNIID